MDPYVYQGTDVLINQWNVRDPVKLEIIEARLFALKSLEPLPSGFFNYDHLKAIHFHFFSDIYPWAGQERTIDITKDGSYFARKDFINKELTKLFTQLKDEQWLRGLKQKYFCKKLSFYFNEINAAHPFREGNGRTLRAFCDLLSQQAGYHLDWTLITQKEYLEANIAGFMYGNYNAMAVALEKILFADKKMITTKITEQLV